MNYTILFLLFSLLSCSGPAVDKLITAAVSEKTLPGGVLLITKDSKEIYKKAYGSRDLETTNNLNTLYDVASLTKVVTALSVMILKEEEKIKLDDKLIKFYPELKGESRKISIENLLRHQSGYPASIAVVESEPYDKFIQRAVSLEMEYPRGTSTVYSDVGFIILGDIVTKTAGISLSEFAKLKIFSPLKMNKTSYQVGLDLKKDCAPTGVPLCLPHDPKALSQYPHSLGHAGVFSTIDDLARLAQMLLLKGELEGVRILSQESILEMTQIKEPQIRGLGFDLLSPYARAPRGEVFPPGLSYGHTGFTGTTLWIDPKSNSYYIFLSNRVFLGAELTGKAFTELRFNLSTQVGEIIYQ